MNTTNLLSSRHLALSADPTLSIADRYRQLAAYHVTALNYRAAVQAMWASTASLDSFVPLDDLIHVFRGQPSPLWLRRSGEAANYPCSASEHWDDIEGLGEQHAEISRMAISRRVKSIHGAVAYILSGRYGFAIQCLKSSEQKDSVPSLEELAAGTVSVDASPPWVACWDEKA